LNATSYALYLVLVKRLLGKYNTLTVSKWTFLIGLVMVLPFGFRELISADFTTMPQDIIFKIVFIVLCTTFLAYLLTAWAVIKIGSSTVGTYIYLQPLFTALISMLLGRNDLTVQKVLAAVIIFAGVFCSTYSKKSHPKITA
ncbi:MAG: DMT family transporter, partial [Bacteroidia bacterium]|nr:DMT family transporter [Bacteroidia bacterium]